MGSMKKCEACGNHHNQPMYKVEVHGRQKLFCHRCLRPRILTPTQLKVLDFVDRFHRERHYAPTVKEVGEHFGVSAVAAKRTIDRLVEKGWLNRQDNARLTLKPAQPEGV